MSIVSGWYRWEASSKDVLTNIVDSAFNDINQNNLIKGGS